jgi:hypothetical protein
LRSFSETSGFGGGGIAGGVGYFGVTLTSVAVISVLIGVKAREKLSSINGEGLSGAATSLSHS